MTPGRRPGGWSRGLEGLREHLRLLADRCRARRLRLRGAQVGRKVGIGPRVRVDRPWGVALGPRVRLEQDVHLKLVVDGARVEIGERAYLGPGAWDALQKMAPRRERGQLIEKLIVQEFNRRNAK